MRKNRHFGDRTFWNHFKRDLGIKKGTSKGPRMTTFDHFGKGSACKSSLCVSKAPGPSDPQKSPCKEEDPLVYRHFTHRKKGTLGLDNVRWSEKRF